MTEAASTAAPHLFIVTGASRGLGAALVRALFAPNHQLVCVARSRNTELEQAAADSGARLAWHLQDLSQPSQAASWLASMLDAQEGTPASITLVLNAGVIDPIVPIAQLQEATLVPHLMTNLVSPMTMTAAFLAHSERFGCPRKVLAISSGAARRPIEGWSAYCAGKAALDMFVRSINAEYGQLPPERGVRAVALAPGVVDTGMQATIRQADFAQVERFRQLKEQDQLTSPDAAAARIAAYLQRPDFGATELDDIRNT